MVRSCPLFQAGGDFGVYSKKSHSYGIIASQMRQQVEYLQHHMRVNLLSVVLFLRIFAPQLRNFEHAMPWFIVKPFRSEMQKEHKVGKQSFQVMCVYADSFDQRIGILGVFYIIG